jgi:hypothetical protein
MLHRLAAGAVVLSILLSFPISLQSQGRSRRVRVPIPGLPSVWGGGHLGRQSCVQSCNGFHKNESQICRGRTGRDRAACQRSINEQHQLCIASCPR